jgi:hypothetical protein
MRRGINGLALQVQEALQRDPHLCVGRGYVRRGPGAADFAVMTNFAATYYSDEFQQLQHGILGFEHLQSNRVIDPHTSDADYRDRAVQERLRWQQTMLDFFCSKEGLAPSQGVVRCGNEGIKPLTTITRTAQRPCAGGHGVSQASIKLASALSFNATPSTS